MNFDVKLELFLSKILYIFVFKLKKMNVYSIFNLIVSIFLLRVKRVFELTFK